MRKAIYRYCIKPWIGAKYFFNGMPGIKAKMPCASCSSSKNIRYAAESIYNFSTDLLHFLREKANAAFSSIRLYRAVKDLSYLQETAVQ